jgi:Fe-S-cluster containining protein
VSDRVGPFDAVELAWLHHASDARIETAIHDVHAHIARETAVRSPRCDLSGRCCRFEAWGHRLYITGLETAWFLQRAAAAPDGPSSASTGVDHPGLSANAIDLAIAGGTCPFLSAKRCRVHLIRPMGCRVYFCDTSARDWQNDLFERCHRTIADLHERESIPYEFGEWRAMLKRVALAAPDLASNVVLPDASSDVRFIRVGRS